MLAPEKIWWKPLGRLEKNWLIIAFTWCVMLTAMMPIWYFFGHQNVPATTYRTTPQEYKAKVDEFVAQYQVDEQIINGIPIPVVEGPPGDVFLLARQWQWYPILKLHKDETYRIHVSSLDVQHGFSIQPVNLNFQVLPKYDYVVTLTPTTAGEFTIVCNEYCFVLHHTMIGRIFVEE